MSDPRQLVRARDLFNAILGDAGAFEAALFSLDAREPAMGLKSLFHSRGGHCDDARVVLRARRDFEHLVRQAIARGGPAVFDVTTESRSKPLYCIVLPLQYRDSAQELVAVCIITDCADRSSRDPRAVGNRMTKIADAMGWRVHFSKKPA